MDDNLSYNIYVVLFWFWDSDSYLVGSYRKCFKSMSKAKEYITKEFHRQELLVYLPGDILPKEKEGHYGVNSFFEIRKEVI